MPKTRNNKIHRRRTQRQRGGSKKYQFGNITTLDEKFGSLDFFRKYGSSIVEHRIAAILKKNPHPNIVNIYRITDSYIDIEEVKPATSIKYDKKELISAAKSAKEHLQKLGIMYIDWKPDNMGLGTDGKYKLYDFDASGITTPDKKKWVVRPHDYWSYRQAIANRLKDPVKIDNFAFDINFIKTYIPLNTS